MNVVQLAVGFADLAGYTGLWEELEPHHLALMLDRFEATTGDVIVAAGANVVKRIGDAVMFVTNAPGIGCALAVDLLEACAAAKLPKLRVGIAFGDVMVRQGDFYGPTVNLAARLVSSAEAGTALTDASMFERLAHVARRLRLRARRSLQPRRLPRARVGVPVTPGIAAVGGESGGLHPFG